MSLMVMVMTMMLLLVLVWVVEMETRDEHALQLVAKTSFFSWKKPERHRATKSDKELFKAVHCALIELERDDRSARFWRLRSPHLNRLSRGDEQNNFKSQVH